MGYAHPERSAGRRRKSFGGRSDIRNISNLVAHMKRLDLDYGMALEAIRWEITDFKGFALEQLLVVAQQYQRLGLERPEALQAAAIDLEQLPSESFALV